MPEQLPLGFWESERQLLRVILKPRLVAMAQLGVEANGDKLRELGIVFDPTLTNTRAAEWAARYTDTLLEALGTTNQKVVGQAVSDWINTPGGDIKDLSERLARELKENYARAERIAGTEVVRAANEGEALGYADAGLPMPVFLPPLHPNCRCSTHAEQRGENWYIVWETSNDERVCITKARTPYGTVNGCSEMHGKVLNTGEKFWGRL